MNFQNLKSVKFLKMMQDCGILYNNVKVVDMK